MPYTKLFNSIITSTLWLEPDHTRLVWITMLALADKNGEVQASVPGLAKLAGVSVDRCREALKSLSEPDPDSRTKVAEGRRIAEISGGWELINHAKYRRMASEEDAREANAQRQKRFRERNGEVTDSNAAVTPDNGTVTHEGHKQRADANTDPEADASPLTPTRKRAVRVRLECGAFTEFWQAYPRKEAIANAEKAWTANYCAPLIAQILVAVRARKISPDWTKEGGRFIPHPATWLNRRGWEDEIAVVRTNGALEGEDFSHLVEEAERNG